MVHPRGEHFPDGSPKCQQPIVHSAPKGRRVYWAGSAAGSRPRRAPYWRPSPNGLMGASGGVFSPSCDASHRHPAPLQKHPSAQAGPGSPAAQPVFATAANRLLLGSDLPRGSLARTAPALGRLGPRPAGGLRPSTHSLPLGDSRLRPTDQCSGAVRLAAANSAATSCPSISATGSVHCWCVVVL